MPRSITEYQETAGKNDLLSKWPPGVLVLVPAAIYWIANSLEVIILHREPLICVENIIPGLELPEFQNTGVQEALLNKKMMLSFDTGMGKTYTYA